MTGAQSLYDAAPQPDADLERKIAWLLQASANAYDALQEPDPDLAHERAVMAGKPIPAPVRRRAA